MSWLGYLALAAIAAVVALVVWERGRISRSWPDPPLGDPLGEPRTRKRVLR